MAYTPIQNAYRTSLAGSRRYDLSWTDSSGKVRSAHVTAAKRALNSALRAAMQLNSFGREELAQFKALRGMGLNVVNASPQALSRLNLIIATLEAGLVEKGRHGSVPRDESWDALLAEIK